MSKLQLADLIGNKDICTQIMISHGAARLHNRAMHHQLYCGCAGCGKTTTAGAVAQLGTSPFFKISAESIKTAEQLAALFNKFPDEGYDPQTGDIVGTINPPIVFIDEAHQMTLASQELLGVVMENYEHIYVEGKGKRKHTAIMWVPRFTLICATTKEGALSKPFRDRFPLTMVFSHYSVAESAEIVTLHANKDGIAITDDAIKAIAQRGRGTPRILVRFLKRSFDFMAFMGKEAITLDVVEAQFRLQKIDPIGLTAEDIIILKELYNSEAPKGLDSLGVKTNLDPKTISEVKEPYLITLGMIERTRGGRIITDEGVKHLIKYGHIKAQATQESYSRILKRVRQED